MKYLRRKGTIGASSFVALASFRRIGVATDIEIDQVLRDRNKIRHSAEDENQVRARSIATGESTRPSFYRQSAGAVIDHAPALLRRTKSNIQPVLGLGAKIKYLHREITKGAKFPIGLPPDHLETLLPISNSLAYYVRLEIGRSTSTRNSCADKARFTGANIGA